MSAATWFLAMLIAVVGRQTATDKRLRLFFFVVWILAGLLSFVLEAIEITRLALAVSQ